MTGPKYDQDDFDADLASARDAASGSDCAACRAAAVPPQRTPLTPDNPPGQSALSYRIGTQPLFLASMIDQLTTAPNAAGQPPRLDALTSRAADDLTVALLDAAAVMFDVVTFYQERIANENYLRTATEPVSVEALAALLNYQPRPGVSARTQLAFTVEDGKAPLIPAGTAAQSVPDNPGDLPQTFETGVAIQASALLNLLGPLTAHPTKPLKPPFADGFRLTLAGTGFNLSENDPLLYDVDPKGLTRVKVATEDFAAGRTTVRLRPWRDDPRADPTTPDGLTATIRRLSNGLAAAADLLDAEANSLDPGATPSAADLHGLATLFRGTLADAVNALANSSSANLPSDIVNNVIGNLPNYDTAQPADAPPSVLAGAVARQRAEMWAFLAALAPGKFGAQSVGQELRAQLPPPPAGDVTGTTPGELGELFEVDFFRARLLPALAQAADRSELSPAIKAAVTEFRTFITDRFALSGVPREVSDWLNKVQSSSDAIANGVALSDADVLDLWETLDRYLMEDQAGLPDDNYVADRVIVILKQIQKELTSNSRANIPGDAFSLLSALQSQQVLASAAEYPRVRPWLDAVIDDLGDAIGRLTRAPSSSPGAAGGGQDQPTPADKLARTINKLVGQLTSAVTGAPLAPSSDKLVPISDVLPAALALIDATAQPSLLAALEQLDPQPSTQPNTIKVFRAQARPFGADARPRPVLDDRNRQVGEADWAIDPLLYSLKFSIRGLGQAFAITAGTTKITASLGWLEQTGQLTQANPNPGPEVTDDLAAGKRLALTAAGRGSAALTITRAEAANGTLLVELSLALDGSSLTTTYQAQGSPAAGAAPQMVVISADGGWVVPLFAASQQFEQWKGAEHIKASVTASPNITDIVLEDHTFPAPLSPDRLRQLTLDRQYKDIVPGGVVVIDRPDPAQDPGVCQVLAVEVVTVSAYGLSATATRLTLDSAWLKPTERTVADLRRITVYAQSEALPLGLEPFDADVQGDTIELDGIYPGLDPDRLLIVRGERTDIDDTGGVRVAEQAQVQAARQVYDSSRPGDRLHTQLTLTNKLAYPYKRATVEIFANVAPASHGATVPGEVLGNPAAPSGDGAAGPTRLTLRQGPLTFVPDELEPAGRPALQVFVNNVQWHAVDSLADLPPDARNYVIRVASDGTTTLLFGDGHEGATPPPDPGAIVATYRYGLGLGGNVKAGAITMLVKAPLGVKAVTNPRAATGGADRDSPEVTRARAPLAVATLGRLVGVPDYQAYALSSAGIGKAQAVKLPPASGAYKPRVAVTVAAEAGAPLAQDSQLVQDLQQSLIDFGDPDVDVVVLVRGLVSAAFEAKVRIDPDYIWAKVQGDIQQALLAQFGFDRRDLAQPLWLSEVVAAVQGVSGVHTVDVVAFGKVAEGDDVAVSELSDNLHQLENASPSDRPQVIVAHPTRLHRKTGEVRPAQLVVFNPNLAGTVIINPWDTP